MRKSIKENKFNIKKRQFFNSLKKKNINKIKKINLINKYYLFIYL